MHLSTDMYQMFLAGEISAEALLRAAHDHLLELCDDCRDGCVQDPVIAAKAARALNRLVATGRTSTTTRPLEDDEHQGGRLRQASLPEISRQEGNLKALRKERRKAGRDVRALRQLPHEDRRGKIENARTRYRSAAFVELLLEESRRQIRHDVEEARNLASLVPVAIHWMAGGVDPRWAFKIQALAAAHEANALRILGDLEGADRQLRDLRRRLVRSPTLSSGELAEITNIEAALRFIQRRYNEAEALMERAALHYRLADDPRGLAQALIQKGNLYFHQGRFPAALTTYNEASPLLDPEEEPFLAECIVTGRVLTNCELGEFDDAQELLMTYRSLYESRDAYGTTQFRGLQGRIALGLEQWHDAEIAYSDCRDGHLAIGRFHDATLASLDVARAMLQQGKLAEVTTMAAEILEIFKARGADQEVLGAMVLIQEAAASRSLSLTLLAKARKRLEERRS